MKNQYFGDENDYHKYGLIRILSDHGKFSTGICWMLTPDDGRNDGRFTDYLRKPSNWRHHDPELYDALIQIVTNEKHRNVLMADSPDVLPSMKFHDVPLGDGLDERKEYFRKTMEKLWGVDLLFFDPDNGLETQSTPIGRKNSSKYIYWNEIQESFHAGHSLLVYQHFPRISRDRFTENLAKEFSYHTRSMEIHAYATSRVVFFLVPQLKHLEYFRVRMDQVRKKWGGADLSSHFSV
jgi:hypothetical protein